MDMSFQQLLLVFALVTAACNVFALDNGLGATRKCSALVVPPTLSLSIKQAFRKKNLIFFFFRHPSLSAPMGWSSWNVYAGGVNEQKIMSTIDAMATMKDVGYEYV